MKALTLSFVRVRLVVVVAILNVVLLVMGWMIIVAPQRHHALAAAQQLQQAQNELATLGGPQTTPQTPLRGSQAGAKTIYGPLAHAMPTTADEPDLLLELDSLARSSGVRVIGISPQTPTAGTTYTIVPVTLNLAGGYYAITNYLYRLRMLVHPAPHAGLVARGRLFSVTSVAYAPGTAGKTVTATITVDAFVYGVLAGATPLVTATTPTTTGSTTTSSTTTTPSG